MNTTKALLFDFNGTLIWDSDINFRAWDRCVRSWLGRAYTQTEYGKYNGRTGKETIESLFNGNVTDRRIHELTSQVHECYFDICKREKPLSLAPGIEDFIEYAKLNGLVCAIATSASDAMMDRYFPLLHLERLFDRSLVVCNNGKFRSKPCPDVFISAVERVGFKSDECMAFEDTSSGLRSAYDAGVGKIIAVTGDNTSELITDVPCLAKIHDFTDPFLRSCIC